jgi:hypothetical protein
MSEFIDVKEWIPVHTLPGFECCIEYYVSHDGRVMSTKGGKEKILKGAVIKNGYHKVTLQQRLGQKGEIQPYVHTLVALAFLPPPPTPMGRTRGSSVVDHKDENKLNNCVSNLHWISVKENICKHPYRKFQPVEQTEDQKLVQIAKDKYNARMRQRRRREKLKAVKIVESDIN